MASARWAAPISGAWDAGADWSTGMIPGGAIGSDDVATIDAPGTYTVSVGNSGITNIGSVSLAAPGATLAIAGGGLAVKTALTLNGGTVRGGTVRVNGATLRLNTNSSFDLVGTLDGVRVLGDLTVANGGNLFPRYNPVLALRNGITFASPSGTGRGSLTVLSPGAELRALDAETLDHVDLRFSSSSNYNSNQSLTTAAGTTLALGSDAALNVLSAVAVGGGGTFGYAGAVTVQSGGNLAVASGTTLARTSSGSMEVAAGGTLSLAWAGTAAPLAGVAGAVVDGTLALAGSLTSAAYMAALGRATGAGAVSVSGTLDNTGATLALPGTLAGRLSILGTLRGGTVAPGTAALTLGSTATLDGVTFQGPATLVGNNRSVSLESPLGLTFFRNGLTLLGAGSGPGALTLRNLSLQAADAELLDNATLRLTDATLSGAIGTRLTLGAGLALDVTGSSTLTNATSQGSIKVEDNSTLTVDGSFVGNGALTLGAGSRLSLSGSTTTAGLARLLDHTAGPGTVGLAFDTVLDNTGATLVLLANSRFDKLAGFHTTLRGGTVTNAGGSLGLTGTTVLDGVTWQGAFAPTARADFRFRNGTVVQGVGGRALIDLGGSGSSLDLSGPLDNTDLTFSAAGSLSASASGPVVLGTGTTLTTSGSFSTYSPVTFSRSDLSNAGTITNNGDAAYAALTNTGTIAVSNGSASASTLANSGLISLDAATLTIGTPILLGGTIAFMDPTARLVFQGSGAVGATLQNFQNGDSIDIQGLAYNASLSVSLQGDAVQVKQGSVLVGNFHLLGGTYGTGQFSLAGDGAGGTLLRTTHRLNPPVFAGAGRDFDPAYYLAQNPDVAGAGLDPLQHYLSHGWHEGRNPNAYLSTNWYLNQNPDVAAAGADPLQHFEDYGWKEGRDPGPGFSVNGYLAANPDVRAAGIDPLQHFLDNGRAEGRSAVAATPHAVGAQDALVDRTWYLAQHPDVAASGEDASAHYHRVGWTLGYNPDQWFDTTYYLKANPDIAAARIDPLAHFEASGYREGREPSLAFSDHRYLASNPDVAAAHLDPLAHYMSYGRSEGRMAFVNGPQATGTPDPLVDRASYFAQFATIVPASADAAASYDQAGWRQGLNPDAYFDTNYYLAGNPDVRTAGINPLQHYEAYGWKEGRDPSAAFSTSKYLAAYSDVRSSGADPLTSFITTGQAQGRTAFAV